MAEHRLHQLPDGALEALLHDLEPAIAWPAAELPGGLDIAATVRARIETMPAPAGDARTGSGAAGWRAMRWRPARRALVLALFALLAVAAMAGAIGLGLPGLRLILGEAPTPPAAGASPSQGPGASALPGALGASMGLGEALDPLDAAGLEARAGFDVRAPADAALGRPDAAYIDDAKGGQVTLLWGTRADLPDTLEPGVGLLLGQFRGTVDQGLFNKMIGARTIVEPVRVAGSSGFWLRGDPHIFWWEGPDGLVDDTRRWVGDVLLWSDGPITYRLETSLGRDEAIRIAETMP
jgi:hypothetical protein